MMRFTLRGLCLVLLSAALLGGLATANPQGKGDKKGPDKKGSGGTSKYDPDRKDDRKGARWEWILFDPKDKEAERGTFHADRVHVFHGEKQIGTYVVTDNKH